MMAIIQGKLSLVVCLIFPVLLIAGLILSRTVAAMRRELEMAEYAEERGPIEQAPALPDKADCVPGYTMMTWKDYEEIMRSLAEEMKKGQKR